VAREKCCLKRVPAQLHFEKTPLIRGEVRFIFAPADDKTHLAQSRLCLQAQCVPHNSTQMSRTVKERKKATSGLQNLIEDRSLGQSLSFTHLSQGSRHKHSRSLSPTLFPKDYKSTRDFLAYRTLLNLQTNTTSKERQYRCWSAH